jgi:hypothetical protein
MENRGPSCLTITRNFPSGVKSKNRIWVADPSETLSKIRLAAVVIDIRELSETELERLVRGIE